MRLLKFLPVGLALWLLAPISHATLPAPAQVLSAAQPGAPSAVRFFGQNLSVDGDVAAIGAPHNTGNGSGVAGTVFIFRRSGGTWTYSQALQAPVPGMGDGYGYSVAVVGGTLLVGAPFGDSGRGALYVYGNTGNSFQLAQTIAAPVDVVASDWFGLRSSADAGWMSIGAPSVSSAGAVYLYRFDGLAESWVYHSKIVPSAVGAARFGFALGLRGNQLVVGSPLDVEANNSQGAAYAFSRTGDGGTAVWNENQRFRMTADAGSSAPQLFGLALSLDSSGTRAAIGAPFAGALGGVNAVVGAIFVFERSGNTWTQTARVDSPSATRSRFGSAVSLEGDLLLGGDPLDSATSPVRGAASLFRLRHSNWVSQESWYRSSGGGSNYGISVGLAGQQVLVGDSTADEPGATDRGLTFVHLQDAVFKDGLE